MKANLGFFLSAVIGALGVSGCLPETDASSTDAAPAAQEAPAPRALAKFEPPEGKVLMFIGQDNESVGGSEKWSDGYVDTFGPAAGMTHYVYFTEGKTNRFGAEFDVGHVDGLNSETTWAAGPMCMRCYLESETYDNSVVHLSISMEHDDEPQVAAGEHDHLIDELAAFLNEFSHVPFLIRIGYEFDGEWNHYEPEAFKTAWRRIVDGLKAQGAENFATVMASSTMGVSREVWDSYWPGDAYVDWVGYSYWSGNTFSSETLDLAREKGKPILIAEATPRGFRTDTGSPLIWFDWFAFAFQHMEDNADIIKGFAYINAHWESQTMWEGGAWGDSRIEANEFVTNMWKQKMAEDRYVHQTEGTYDLIRFSPETAE